MTIFCSNFFLKSLLELLDFLLYDTRKDFKNHFLDALKIL